MTQPIIGVHFEKSKKNKKVKKIILALLFIVIAFFLFFSFRLGIAFNKISITNDPYSSEIADQLFGINLLPIEKDYDMPKEEKDRLDILVLGVRDITGYNGTDGELLADSIVVVSFDKSTGKKSMISIPRDLYIKFGPNKKEKINAVYVLGLATGDALGFSKSIISRITGVYIDKVLVVDMNALKSVTDMVGGIDIHLSKPFEEASQWTYPFKLPAGDNHLNGEQALYYVRSRFSSSDFDRIRRQQEVIFALEDKLLSLGFLANPIKINELVGIVEKNIRTDIGLSDISSFFGLVKDIAKASQEIKKYALTTENLLYETKENEHYVLLPQGDNFDKIKEFFRDIIK